MLLQNGIDILLLLLKGRLRCSVILCSASGHNLRLEWKLHKMTDKQSRSINDTKLSKHLMDAYTFRSKTVNQAVMFYCVQAQMFNCINLARNCANFETLCTSHKKTFLHRGKYILNTDFRCDRSLAKTFLHLTVELAGYDKHSCNESVRLNTTKIYFLRIEIQTKFAINIIHKLRHVYAHTFIT